MAVAGLFFLQSTSQPGGLTLRKGRKLREAPALSGAHSECSPSRYEGRTDTGLIYRTFTDGEVNIYTYINCVFRQSSPPVSLSPNCLLLWSSLCKQYIIRERQPEGKFSAPALARVHPVGGPLDKLGMEKSQLYSPGSRFQTDHMRKRCILPFCERRHFSKSRAVECIYRPVHCNPFGSEYRPSG